MSENSRQKSLHKKYKDMEKSWELLKLTDSFKDTGVCT